MQMKFKAKLVGRGPGHAWTILRIPFDVQLVFGRKSRVPVRGTMNRFSFRNSLMPEGDGTHFMMVNKGLQKGAKAKPSDTVAVVIELDKALRTVILPKDLKSALSRTTALRRAFAALPYSRQKEFVDWVMQAKKPETRTRRIQKTLEMLAAGQRLKI
jgi:hypothetical protein